VHCELHCPIRHLATSKAVILNKKERKTKGNIHLEKYAAFSLPTSSVEDAEKALSGRVKSQPTPRGLEQGAAGTRKNKNEIISKK